MRMTSLFRSPPTRTDLLGMVGLVAGVAAIFVADTFTDYAVAAALFYTLVVLLSVRLLTRTGVVLLAAICLALIVLSFHLTPAGSYRVGVINSCISAVVVAVTTYLAVQMEAAKASAHAAQARLLRLTRSGSMGGLAASIAHEVNQPLAAIVTSGNACQRWLAQQPPNLAKADAALERMLADAGRASAIIARMRALARGEASQRQPLDLNRTVLDMIALTRGETERHGIALSLELDPALPAVLPMAYRSSRSSAICCSTQWRHWPPGRTRRAASTYARTSMVHGHACASTIPARGCPTTHWRMCSRHSGAPRTMAWALA